jgi:hypothetical protein
MTPINGIRDLPPGPGHLANLGRAGWAAVAVLAAGLFATFASASEDISREQMKGLDEQVQEIKTDVLSIAAELNGLEERLLYPSNTQVAIFVALGEDEDFRLDAVQVQIDGAPVAHHIYSFKELEALQMGGVQRIYTGNIPTGDHELGVTVAGKLKSGKEFSETASFGFRKEVEPKLVGITLAGISAGGSGIELGEW